jgi:serine protease Do
VNALGEVVGVNSSIFSPNGGSIGLGFAIPINRARRVAEDLVAHGRIRRPWIGIQTTVPRGPAVRAPARAGVAVSAVTPGSPAARAGLQRGDVLVRAGNRVLRNPYDWEAVLLDLRVGDDVSLTVRRGGREFSATVTVADLPEESAPKVSVLRELELITLTPAIRAERQVQSSRGALVYNVSDRVADAIGIQKGDVIVQVNRVPIERAEDVNRAIAQSSGFVRMFFERGGRIYSADFTVR